jgi:hypothetical protein
VFITCIGYSVGKKRSRRGKLVQMTSLKPRIVEGGPKRTPPHLEDAWQEKTDYEVEHVITGLF